MTSKFIGAVLLVPQAQVAGGLIKISLEAALAADGALFGENLGKCFDHQVLGFVDIFDIAVYVLRLGVAVFFEQQIGGVFLAVQISPVYGLIRDYACRLPSCFLYAINYVRISVVFKYPA